MKQPSFVNRHNDFNCFSKKLTIDKNKNKLIFLYGYSGVGKSRFVEETFKKTEECIKSISIPIVNNSTCNIQPFQFFNNAYEIIYNYKTNKKILYQKEYSINSIGIGFCGISVSAGGNSHYSYEPHLIKKLKFLINFFNKSKEKIIISFQNFQIIDNSSLEMINKIISSIKGHVFIFEYTISDEEDKKHMFNMMNNFLQYNSALEIDNYRLDKIPCCELDKILKEKGFLEKDFWILEDKFNADHGNLLNIILPTSQEQLQLFMDNPVIETIVNGLSSEEKIFLYIVFLMKGEIEKSILNKLVLKCSALHIGLEKTISSLESKQLLKVSNLSIKIAHDSISKTIEGHASEIQFFYAYQIVESFYSEQPYCENKITMLFDLYVFMEDKRLINVMPDVIKVAYSQKYPKTIVQKFKDICGAISNEKYTKFQINLLREAEIRLLINLGNYDEAYNLVSECFCDENIYHKVYLGAIFALRNEKNDIEALEKLIIESENTHLEFVLKLYKLVNYMEFNSAENGRLYALDLINTKKYEKYKLEYLFLLSIYSEYQNSSEAINMLKYCISEYKKMNLAEMTMKCNIALSARYAYIGDLKKAKKILKDISKLEFVRREYVLNNLAALNILEKNFSQSTEEYLEEALLINVDLYDRQIILSNLLILYTHNNEYDKGLIISNQLENYLINNPNCYEELRHIILQNLKYFYSFYGQLEKSNDISQQIETLCEENIDEDFKIYIKKINNICSNIDENNQWSYYSQLEYRPDFLAYWAFEIPKSFDNGPYNF